MAIVLERTAPAPDPRKRWTVSEVVELEGHGMLSDGRYELLNGELFRKMGQNNPHILASLLTAEALRTVFASDTVTEGIPFHLSEHDAPQPDVAVFRGRPRDYAPNVPTAEDIILFVEVVDSRLDTAEAKIGLYARNGINEYWILDIPKRRLRVMKNPMDGIWAQVDAYEVEDRVSLNGREILVADLLGIADLESETP